MKKPVFTKLLQIGIVVKDLDKTVKTYADKYGIGPWSFYEQRDILTHCISYGKAAEINIKVACAFLDGLELELIQPMDDDNMYAEFVKEHGGGLHHLAFDIEDCTQTLNFFRKENVPVCLNGIFGGEEEFYYVDTRADLACISEFYNRVSEVSYPEPTKIYPPENN